MAVPGDERRQLISDVRLRQLTERAERDEVTVEELVVRLLGLYDGVDTGADGTDGSGVQVNSPVDDRARAGLAAARAALRRGRR